LLLHTFTIIVLLATVFSFSDKIMQRGQVSFYYLLQRPATYIMCGIAIYYTGSIPVFLLAKYADIYSGNLLFYINDTLNIVSYSLLLTAFLCKPQTSLS
ncbi:MAG: hypothetical protein WBA74_00205, partial [Cyclobacteriaceae bacterium]